MPTLVEKILAIHEALRSADVPHAFGGALALAFHIEEPRATRDIDVNVFAPSTHAREVFEAMPSEVAWTDHDVERIAEVGQVRVFWDDSPVDLFFSTHAFHDRAEREVLEVPFAGTTLPVLGATELAVFKAFFNRTKDWADIEEMLRVGSVDVHRTLGWLVDLLGPDDERVERFRSTLGRVSDDGEEPRFDP
jgi:hypothetical protein